YTTLFRRIDDAHEPEQGELGDVRVRQSGGPVAGPVIELRPLPIEILVGEGEDAVPRVGELRLAVRPQVRFEGLEALRGALVRARGQEALGGALHVEDPRPLRTSVQARHVAALRLEGED